MISKFNGHCKTCNQPYAEGDDIFWTKESGAHCWDCIDNPRPTAADFLKAARLGFIQYAEDTPADGLLRRMLPGDRNLVHQPDDRGNPARGEQSSLFAVPQKESA